MSCVIETGLLKKIMLQTIVRHTFDLAMSLHSAAPRDVYLIARSITKKNKGYFNLTAVVGKDFISDVCIDAAVFE